MLWYKQLYKDLDQDYLEYDQEERHYLLALGLSLFFYVLLLAFVFFEIPRQTDKTPPRVIPLGNDLIDHMPRRASPARVVSMPVSRPKKTPVSPVPKPITQPEPSPKLPGTITKKLLPDPEKTGIPKPSIEKPPFEAAPVTPTPAPELFHAADQSDSTPVPVNTGRNGAVQNITPENTESTSPPVQLPARRGRGSWVKTSGPVSHTTGNNTGNNQTFSQLEDISTQRVSRLPANQDGEGGAPTYGSPLGNGGTVPPELAALKMELELFQARLVHTICDASHQDPFYYHYLNAERQVIVFSITVARNRHITNVSFMQPSPNKALNDYLEKILYATHTPQLPARWPRDELTIVYDFDTKSLVGSGCLVLIPHSRS